MASTILRWGILGAVLAAGAYVAAGVALLIAAARARLRAAPGHSNRA